ncbi:replication factor A protein 1 family protein [Abortiporus biennis]
MSETIDLSKDTCLKLDAAGGNDEVLRSRPILQVVSIKTHSTPQERFTLILSDGSYYTQIQKYSIIQVESMIKVKVRDKWILLLNNISVVSNAKEKIGFPQAPPKAAKNTLQSPQGDKLEQQPTVESSHAHQSVKVDDNGVQKPQVPRKSLAAPDFYPSQPQTSSQTEMESPPYVPTQYTQDHQQTNSLAHTTNAPPQSSSTSTSVPPTTPSHQPEERQTTPIQFLNPYLPSWTIKAKVTSLTNPQSSNKPGSRFAGKFFKVTFADSSGSIRCVCFDEEVHGQLQEQKTYYVSNAIIKAANRQYNADPYELTLNKRTVIEECMDVCVERPEFMQLSDLYNRDLNSTSDVIAIVTDTSSTEVTLAGRKTQKRELTITDRSHSDVTVAIWGMRGQQYATISDNPTIILRDIRIGPVYQGVRSLTATNNTHIEVNPDTAEAHELKQWFQEQIDRGNPPLPPSTSTVSVNMVDAASALAGSSPNSVLLNDIKQSGIGESMHKVHIATRASIHYIPTDGTDSFTYPSCSETCGKKVKLVNGETGPMWRCDKCEKDVTRPRYRYRLGRIYLRDSSGQLVVSAFDSVGETLFGISADDLLQLQATDEQRYKEIVKRPIGKMYNFSLDANLSTFNNRTQYTIQNLSPPDWKAEAHHQMNILMSSWAQQAVIV